jgi:hypothetical protein
VVSSLVDGWRPSNGSQELYPSRNAAHSANP